MENVENDNTIRVLRDRNGCIDLDYAKKYYQSRVKGVQVQCQRCSKYTSKANMSKHVKRNSCLKVFVVGIIEQMLEDNNIHPEVNENNLKNIDI